MQNIQKYRECIMYLLLIVVVAVFLFKQIQPKFVQTIELFNQVKTQREVSESINKQLEIAKAKVERKNKMRLLDDMTKKIYEPNASAVDSESTFAVLLDDIIEIARNNHIKIHSIQTVLDPEDDVFIKGDKAHYSAARLNMKIVSDYSDFETFIQDLYKYNYLINLKSIEIYPYEKNKRILLINFSLTLYSTKSAEEISATTENTEDNKTDATTNTNPQEAAQVPPPPQP